MSLKILTTGKALPKKILSNDDMSQFLDTSDNWIASHTGIEQRYWVNEESCSQLGSQAALSALEKSPLEAKDIDLILVATSTPDFLGFPSVATMIQKEIGASKAVAYDISAACAGFVFCMETAVAMSHLHYNNILIIGCETMSRILDKTDRNTAVLFGDGAGACLLTKADGDSKIVDTVLKSEGEGGDALKVAPTENSPDKAVIQMNGRDVYHFGIRACQNLVDELLAANNLSLNDISYIIPHQANKRMVQAIAKRMGLDEERFYLNIAKYGNTSAASIPLALDEMIEDQVIQRGEWIVLLGFGAGLNYGGILIKY